MVSVAITKAREFGFTTVSCASTGNLATAVAAHAARAGLQCYIFMPEGVESGKIVGSTIYGAQVITIRGNYDDVNRLCSEIADKYGWAFVNINLRPYYTEGAKTFGFEVAEQLGWKLPDHIVVPTAGGTILPKVAKAFKEFKEVGLIKSGEFKIHSAQAAGSAPVIHALHKHTDLITPVKPNTIAKSIAIGNPADGFYVLKAVRESGGWGDVATDPEIIDAIKLLARTEGIFAEPAGGTTLAVTMKLIEQGRIKPDESVVVSITGNGYKTLEAVASAIEQPSIIEARLKEFDALFERLTNGKRTAEAPPEPLVRRYAAQHNCRQFNQEVVPTHGSKRSSSHSTSQVHRGHRRSPGRRRVDPGGYRGSRKAPSRDARAAARRQRRDSPLRQHLSQRRRHPLPRSAQLQGQGWRRHLNRSRDCRRTLTPARDDVASASAGMRSCRSSARTACSI